MSVYDRAPRNFTFQSSVGTTRAIGPGSYQHFSTISGKSEGYAPFQSLASRDFNLAGDDAGFMPAPSQYDVKLMSKKVLGGSSISNRDSRFKPLKSDIPGPGQYCIEDAQKCHSALTRKSKVSEKSKLLYTRTDVPPSIPNAKTSFGYEEGPCGSLIKQEPPKRDTSIGPAFYDPKVTEGRTTNRYKGCFWSYEKGQRTNFGGAPGPGPGEYEPFSDKWNDMVEYCKSHDNAKLTQLEVPRFFDKLQKQAIKDHIPGPASYNHSGKIDCPRALYNEDGSKIEHPPFMNQAKRFSTSTLDLPGPGSYNDPRTALSSLKKITGMKRSPFGQTATRFIDNVKDDMPGPQDYDVCKINRSSPKPSYISWTKKGGFGSTSIRNGDPSNKDFNEVPGPSHYQPKQPSESIKFHQPLSSMFASLTNRDFDPIIAGRLEQTGGTNYDVITSFNLTQCKREYAEPRTKEAKKRQTSFLSHASRYARGSPLDCPDPTLPGPSTYDHKTYLNTQSGKFYFRDKRFKTITEETPGPGHYELSKEVMNTVLKPTFNSTLGNVLKNENLSDAEEVVPPTRQTLIAI